MKFNFKKVSAVFAGALMLGMTAGIAAAATNYPQPFSTSGPSGWAVVYGSNPQQQDTDTATSIAQHLQSLTGGGPGLGSDTFRFERGTTKFHLGDNITQVVSTPLDEDELPSLLEEGVYTDDKSNQFDYIQKITMGSNLQLTMFEDNDYAEDEPTVGFRIPSGTTVLTYALTFSDEPNVADMPTTDLKIMGKDYFILSIGGSTTTMTLLDSAESTTLREDGTATVAGHNVSVDFISSSEVVLLIDGRATNSLEEGETQKLSDGSYVGIKDIRYNSKDTGVSSVEFSIGSGKLELISGSEVKMNEETISGLTSTITNTTTMSSISLTWTADEDLFVTETSDITMPGFGNVKLGFSGLNYPAEEEIRIEQGGELYAVLKNFPLKDGEADIAFLYGSTAGSFSGIGKDSTSLLLTAAPGGTQNMTWDGDVHDYFVASWVSGDDAESYLLRFTNPVLDGNDNETDVQQYKNGAWTTVKSGMKNGDTFSVGNAELAVGAIHRIDKTIYVWNNSANTNFNTLYSAEGLKVYLPYELAASDTAAPGAIDFDNSTTGHNGTSFHLTMVEESKDDLAAGDTINATIAWTGGTENEVTVSAISTTNTDAASTEIDDTNVFRDFTYSDLATEILFNQPTSGADSVKLIYHGSEVAADVYITSTDTSSSTSDLGGVLVTDAEIESVKSRNLVVVGGSCVNVYAARLLGVTYPTCTTAWSGATGVGSGKFLIQSFDNPDASGKIAVLVAGYEAAETTAAATYLRTQSPDVSSGKKWLGTVGTGGSSTVVEA